MSLPENTDFNTGSEAAPAAPARAYWLIAALTAFALLASGVGFRFLGQAEAPPNPLPLRHSFDTFPRDFLGYRWQSEPLDEETERVAGATAYINLLGHRERDGAGAHLYVSYYGEPRTLIEHEPQVCMVAGGWNLQWGVQQIRVPMPVAAGRPAWELPVNVYVFRKETESLLMLNYYRINSRYFVDRNEGRVISADVAGRGYYTQTRVSIGLSDLDLAGLSEGNQETSEPVKRAIEILQFVVPALDEYLPVVTEAK